MKTQASRLILFLALSAPRLASAGEGDVQRAQALFDEGKAQLDAENYSVACPKLSESKDLAPGIGVTLYLANCEEGLGRKASALAHYHEAEAMAHARGDAREGVAHELVTRLEAETTRIRIHLPSGSAQKVTVTDNGRPVSANTRGFPVDPGTHKIHATSASGGEWTDVVRVPEAPPGSDGGTFDVNVPSLESGGRARDLISEKPGDTSAPRSSSSGTTQKAIAIGVGAAGIVGLGVGTFLGFHAKSLQDESNGTGGGCNAVDTCDAHGQQLRMSALDSATASTVLFAVGGAAVVTGIILYVSAPSSHRDLAVAFGPSNASLTGRF